MLKTTNEQKVASLMTLANEHKGLLTTDPRKAYAMGIVGDWCSEGILSVSDYKQIMALIKAYTFQEN